MTTKPQIHIVVVGLFFFLLPLTRATRSYQIRGFYQSRYLSLPYSILILSSKMSTVLLFCGVSLSMFSIKFSYQKLSYQKHLTSYQVV